VFGCIPENALENILQYYVKNRPEGVGGEVCILTKDFPVNENYFPFDHYFTAKQTPANLNQFYNETNRAKICFDSSTKYICKAFELYPFSLKSKAFELGKNCLWASYYL
jgi:hypothetical protein